MELIESVRIDDLPGLQAGARPEEDDDGPGLVVIGPADLHLPAGNSDCQVRKTVAVEISGSESRAETVSRQGAQAGCTAERPKLHAGAGRAAQSVRGAIYDDHIARAVLAGNSRRRLTDRQVGEAVAVEIASRYTGTAACGRAQLVDSVRVPWRVRQNRAGIHAIDGAFPTAVFRIGLRAGRRRSQADQQCQDESKEGS